MSETNETKKKSGGSGIMLLLLAIGGLWLWKKKKDEEAATDDTASDSGGGGGDGSDGDYQDDVIVDIGGDDGSDGDYQDDVIVDIGGDDGSSDTGNGGNGSGNGSGTTITPIKQAMTARTSDPEWQYQKSRINMNILPAYQKAQIEKGAVTKNTLKSIADYQQVKSGTMSAFDYADDPNMPEEMRAGIEYSSTAYQGSTTVVKARALAYYSEITGAHRGGMSADQRAAWDSANEQAALTAYANASGSGLQAEVASSMAAQSGRTSDDQAKVISEKAQKAQARSQATQNTKGSGKTTPASKSSSAVKFTSGGAKSVLGKGASVGKR